MKHRFFSFNLLPYDRRGWLRVVLKIVIFAATAQISISAFSMMLGFTSTQPWWQTSLFSLVYTTFIVLAQLLSGDIAHRFFPLNSVKAVVGHILILSFAGVVAFSIARYTEQLFTGTCTIPDGLFLVICIVTFVLSLIGNGIFYMSYYHRQVRAAEQAVLESELRALRAQINPHFLFNTLNSIAALIRIDVDDAERVTEDLAELFRYSLRSSKTPLVRLEDELHSVQIYMRIEKARFAERLQLEYSVPPNVYDAAVPSLLLQPLVENAVKHGVQLTEGTCSIAIRANEKDGIIELRVEDTGPGFDVEQGSSIFERGTGLSNVKDRLQLLFGEVGQMVIERQAVILRFPYRQRTEQGTSSQNSVQYDVVTRGKV